MALLDKFTELGESISSKSRNVVQKAKDATGIAGLNSRIHAIDEQLCAQFEQLGRAFFAAKGGPATEEMAALTAQIAELLDEQATIRAQINSIRGVVCCTNCGRELPVGSGFCPDCGTKTPEPVVYVCVKCGQIISETSAFCPYCGASQAKPAAPNS